MIQTDKVTAIKVTAHTADGRVFECANPVIDYDDPKTVASALLDAIEDTGAEMIGSLRAKGYLQ